MVQEFFSCCYSLHLGTGFSWSLLATKRLKSWLGSFASIFELKPSSKIFKHRILFAKNIKEISFYLKNNYPNNLFPQNWGKRTFKNITVWIHPQISDIICEIKLKEYEKVRIEEVVIFLSVIYQIIINSGGFPFHCGLLEKDEEAVLISAPGNTGKSTCCKRIPYPWIAHADDLALVEKEQEGIYFSHPLPTWSDYLAKNSNQNWSIEKRFLIKAIFFIEQTEEKEEVIPLWQGQSTMLILNQIMQKKYPFNLNNEEEMEHKKKLFNNAYEMASYIPCFILRVHLQGKFWEHIEKTLASNPKPLKRPLAGRGVEELYIPQINQRKKKS